MQTKDIQVIIRLKIKNALDKCKPSVYPNFHNLVQTKNGYIKAEEMIINYIVANAVPVSSAMAILESEMG
jgi:hypothetical protein